MSPAGDGKRAEAVTNQPNVALSRQFQGGPGRLKVATYNVNGVNGRLPRLLEWLEETSPDIVCLQEIKTTDEKCPARVLEDAGYGSLWHGQRSHHGVAILAKGERPTELRRGCRATSWTGRRATSRRR